MRLTYGRKCGSTICPCYTEDTMTGSSLTNITDAERDLIVLLRQKREAQRAYDEAVKAHTASETRLEETYDLLMEMRAKYRDAEKEFGG